MQRGIRLIRSLASLDESRTAFHFERDGYENKNGAPENIPFSTHKSETGPLPPRGSETAFTRDADLAPDSAPRGHENVPLAAKTPTRPERCLTLTLACRLHEGGITARRPSGAVELSSDAWLGSLSASHAWVTVAVAPIRHKQRDNRRRPTRFAVAALPKQAHQRTAQHVPSPACPTLQRRSTRRLNIANVSLSSVPELTRARETQRKKLTLAWFTAQTITPRLVGHWPECTTRTITKFQRGGTPLLCLRTAAGGIILSRLIFVFVFLFFVQAARKQFAHARSEAACAIL